MAKKSLGLEEIAAEVGRLFGTTEKHAKNWLNQRQLLLEALSTVRDNANGLIAQLGGENPFPWSAKKKHGRKPGVPVIQPGMRESRKKRVVSATTRAKMREAAKKRWAEKRKKAVGNIRK